eukprot:758830-Hanusia_phi.AAC.2
MGGYYMGKVGGGGGAWLGHGPDFKLATLRRYQNAPSKLFRRNSTTKTANFPWMTSLRPLTVTPPPTILQHLASRMRPDGPPLLPTIKVSSNRGPTAWSNSGQTEGATHRSKQEPTRVKFVVNFWSN